MQVIRGVRDMLKYIGYSDFDSLKGTMVGVILRIVGCIFLAYGIITAIAYLVIETKLQNRLECLMSLIIFIHNTLMFTFLLYRKEAIQRMFSRLEILIRNGDNSLQQTIYDKSINDFERLTSRVNVIWNKMVVPLMIVPAFIQSYFNYYVMEMTSDAFELPIPLA